MQLKISVVVSTILTSSLYAQDYVKVQYLQYNEANNRVDVQAPSLEVNKDFGLDYTLNAKVVSDSVSGGTPIYTDTSSGGTAFSRSNNNSASAEKKNVEFTEQRTYAAVSLLTRLDKSRDEITTSFSRSYESDYASNNLGISYLMWADDSKNRSYNFGFAYQANEILIKECTLNSECTDSTSSASEKMTSSLITGEFGVTQVLDKSSLIKAGLFYTSEDGYLSNSYLNVVRNDTNVVAEIRPNKRTSYGLNLKYFRSINKSIDSNINYKYYTDDWDINSHTIDLNSYYKFSKSLILGVGLRYYTQSEANFYKDSSFNNNEEYASMDDRLSSFNSITYKTNLKYKANKSLEYDIGYNLYKQSTDLSASYLTIGMKYNF